MYFKKSARIYDATIRAWDSHVTIKAIKSIYGEKVSFEKVISNWSPYKSYGSRVLWQWVDNGMPKTD